MMLIKLCCVHLLLICSVFAVTCYGGIRCTKDQAFSNVCPDTHPVCCFLDDELTTGCCKPGTMCELDLDKCQKASPLPKNETAVPLHDLDVRIHLTTGQAVTVIAVCLGILLSVFTLIYGARYCATILAERREAAAQRRQQQLEDPDDDDVNSDDEASYLKTVSKREKIEAMDTEAETNSSDATAVFVKCKLCQVNAVNTVLLDCHHHVVCYDCAQHLKRCPECKKLIRRRKKFYFA